MTNLYTLDSFNLPEDLFGEYLKSGKEHDVYSYAKDPNKVIKIVKEPYVNKNYMFKCLNKDKFNEVPCTIKKQLLGYLTIENKYYPVWIQNKVNNTLTENNKEIYKQLALAMIDNGFYPRSFVSDNLYVYDLHPKNITKDATIIDCLTSEF